MAEQALDVAQTEALFEQMRGEAVAQRVDRDFFLIPHCCTTALWTEWVSRRLCSNRNGDIAALFTLIAQVRVGNRPGRIELRARKRRPKSYPG